MTVSRSKQRVEVDRAIFGHPVIGSLTGRTMSTPDADKPELVEVAVVLNPVDELGPGPYASAAMLGCVRDPHRGEPPMARLDAFVGPRALLSR